KSAAAPVMAHVCPVSAVPHPAATVRPNASATESVMAVAVIPSPATRIGIGNSRGRLPASAGRIVTWCAHTTSVDGGKLGTVGEALPNAAPTGASTASSNHVQVSASTARPMADVDKQAPGPSPPFRLRALHRGVAQPH